MGVKRKLSPGNAGGICEIKIIWYSMNMFDNVNNDLIPNNVEYLVQQFLEKQNIGRVFPLDVIALGQKMGGYQIYYMSDKAPFFNIAEAAVNTEQNLILLNPRFAKDQESVRVGRYILCKIFAHIALGHIPEGLGWVEPKKNNRESIDAELNPLTSAFAYELMLPKVEFLEQWGKVGQNVRLMCDYFGSSQRHVLERKNFLIGNTCGSRKE